MQELEDSDLVGHLEEEALKRRKKIEQMKNKRKQLEQNAGAESNDVNMEKAQLPKPKFRNYVPSDENLKENVLPKATPANVKDQIQDQLELPQSSDDLMEEVDLAKLAPKKVDWDLKRNINSKLEKLEKKTQRAIAELIRERLRSNDVEDLDKATADLEATNKNISDDED